MTYTLEQLLAIMKRHSISISPESSGNTTFQLGWKKLKVIINGTGCSLIVDDEYSDIEGASQVLLFTIVLFTLEGFSSDYDSWLREAGLVDNDQSKTIWELLKKAHPIFTKDLGIVSFPCSTLDWEVNSGLAQEIRKYKE